MKTCAKCGAVKSLDEFHRNANRPSGRGSWCRSCVATNGRRWREANPERKRAASRRAQLRKYGLTLADYDRMLIDQGGGCWVCEAEPGDRRNHGYTNLAVDHDHDTGAVRGLLCHMCNRALGLIEGHTARMAEYITKEREGTSWQVG